MPRAAPTPRALFLRFAPAAVVQRIQFALKEPSRRLSVAASGDPRIDSINCRVERDGFALLPGYLAPAECERGRRELLIAHTTYRDCLHRGEDDRLFGMENASPIARRFADDPMWTELADAYAGEPNCSLFVMGNRIQARGQRYGSGGGWHRDCFARELKVILYLSDVGPDNGPFRLLRGSHATASIYADMKAAHLQAVQNRIEDEEVGTLLERDPDRLVTMCAPAGTAIVFDTSAIHTGAPIRAGERLALTNYLSATRHLANPATLEHYDPILRTPSRRSVAREAAVAA